MGGGYFGGIFFRGDQGQDGTFFPAAGYNKNIKAGDVEQVLNIKKGETAIDNNAECFLGTIRLLYQMFVLVPTPPPPLKFFFVLEFDHY